MTKSISFDCVNFKVHSIDDKLYINLRFSLSDSSERYTLGDAFVCRILIKLKTERIKYLKFAIIHKLIFFPNKLAIIHLKILLILKANTLQNYAIFEKLC